MPVIGTHLYRRSRDDLGRLTEIAHRVMRSTERCIYVETEIDWNHMRGREGPMRDNPKLGPPRAAPAHRPAWRTRRAKRTGL
jgi:hypothetical protein